MNKIKVMSEHLSNKIAAGEVVEKCLSVVKELVENSVDAKSTEIYIYLKEAGLREIKVIDNGTGMNKEDAKLCFERHATSKLYTDDDLFNISSLGFRGEALPSIASVSNVILKTCSDGEIGFMVHIKGGTLIEEGECEARKGTSITVNNLFYNTPARFKYLKSPYTELANITEYIHKMALSYPNIKFKLINDDKEIINTDGSGNLLKVIKDIYGLNITKKMLYIKGNNLDYTIEGYISLPEVNRATKNHISVLVNGRVIKNYILNRVINEAYSSFKEDTRYPIAVINITADPTLIDVNIHPSKLDINFSNFEDLQNLITDTIKEVLKNKLLIPKIEIKEEKPINYENISLNLEKNIVKEPETPLDEEYKKRLENYINDDANITDEELETIREEYATDITPENKLPELYPVGLAFGTYIICQNELGLYLIDQHAAKERVNYEKVSFLMKHPTGNTISPLIPINIELPLNEAMIIEKNMDILASLNIKVERFGNSSFRVIEHPLWFTKGYETETIKAIFDNILEKEKNFDLGKFRDNLAKMVSCKMSIKANTDISFADMESLISDLRQCHNPFNCPHGRPTIINFTKYELEKMFKRSI